MKIYFKRNIFNFNDYTLNKHEVFKMHPELLNVLEAIPTNNIDLDFLTKIIPKTIESFDHFLFILMILHKHEFVTIGIDDEEIKEDNGKEKTK